MSESDVHSIRSEELDNVNIYTDPRVHWFKERTLAYTGVENDSLFYNMIADGENKKKFLNFLTAPIQCHEHNLNKKTFYVSKVVVDELIYEDKEYTEWSKLLFYLKIINMRIDCLSSILVVYASAMLGYPV